jgi:hypothetical protein
MCEYVVTHEVTCAIQAQRERHWNGNSPSSKGLRCATLVVIVSVVDVDGGDLEELWNESHPFVEQAKRGVAVVYRA